MFRGVAVSATIVKRGVDFDLWAMLQDSVMSDPIVRRGVNLGGESCGWLWCLWL